MKQYDAIVIGSGMGGLAATLLLASKGKKVVCLEKNSHPGGRLCSFKRDGFTLDMGVHVISRAQNGPVSQVLNMAGAEDTVQYTKVRPKSSFGGKAFSFPHDLKAMVPEKDFDGIMQFVMDIKSFTPEQMEELDDITTEELLNRYTKNNIIHSCVSRIGSVYCSVPSWIASAGEFCRCMQWEAAAKSSGYPDGGCISIVNAYLLGIKKLGGEMKLSSPVERLIVENGKAVGVVVGGEEYRADMIVANSGIKHTILDLAGPQYFSDEYVEHVKGLKTSCISPVVRIALDTVLNTEIKMLGQFYAESQRKYYEMLEQGIIPDELNLFLVIPSNFCPETAPEGKQLVQIATPLLPGTDKALIPKIMDEMIATAEQYIPGMRDHVLFIEKSDLDAVEELVGEDACTIGIAQSAGQVGKKRPKIKTPMEGLYIVGGEAGGHGVGIELCCNSAIEFFENYV